LQLFLEVVINNSPHVTDINYQQGKAALASVIDRSVLQAEEKREKGRRLRPAVEIQGRLDSAASVAQASKRSPVHRPWRG